METFLSQSDMEEVIKNKFMCSDFEIVEWTFKKDEMSSGFFGFPSKEYVGIKLPGGKIVSLHLFIRRIPSNNQYHKDLILKLGVFSKETELYSGLLNELKKFIDSKLYPDCYLTQKDQIIILEDLTVLGFKTVNPRKTFTLDQIESGLETLSKLHAASLAYEEEAGTTLDKLCPEALLETHFVSDMTHPWFHNGCTSMNAIEAIVEAYFPHTPADVYERAYDVIRTLPFRVIPSRKYRNVLCHGGLSANHILFKYNENDEVTESAITSFQNARYNTPALDVLLAIYLTTNNTLRVNNFESLLVHYYNHLSRELMDKDIDIKLLLTWDQFKSSINDAALAAQAMSIIYLHLYLLPKDKIQTILKSEHEYREFIETDRSTIVLEEMRNNNAYRKRIIHAISEIFSCIQNNKKIVYN